MNKFVKKALSVTDSTLGGYLPAPLAAEVIKYIHDLNVARRLFSTFKMPARTWTKPKKNGALSAYFIPDGTTAPLSSFTTGNVKWESRKLMSFAMVDAEGEEDSIVSVREQILEDFGEAIAEAEEIGFLQGDPTHLATAPTPEAATVNNWYRFDPRIAFEGVCTVAATDTEAATAVDANNAALDVDMINKAIYNLGKYGRNRGRLIGMLPPDQAAQVRQNDLFKNALTSGLNMASFITGLGAAGEGNGLVAVIYGVPFFEAPQATAGEIVILDRMSPQIGDRRLIKTAEAVVIEADQTKHVTSERVAFNYNRRAAMVAITKLSTTV